MTVPVATWEKRLAHSIVKSLPWLLLLFVAMLYLGARFNLGVWSGQGSNCMPSHEVWLLDMQNLDVGRGDPVAFTAGFRMAPFFPPELLVVKRLVGLPGDHVVVATDVTTVNGEIVAEGLDVAKTLGKEPQAFHADFVVPEESFFIVGDTRDSFDGRYWGVLPTEALRGRAYGLL